MLTPKTINGFADFISPAANGDMKVEGKAIAQKSKRKARVNLHGSSKTSLSSIRSWNTKHGA